MPFNLNYFAYCFLQHGWSRCKENGVEMLIHFALFFFRLDSRAESNIGPFECPRIWVSHECHYVRLKTFSKLCVSALIIPKVAECQSFPFTNSCRNRVVYIMKRTVTLLHQDVKLFCSSTVTTGIFPGICLSHALFIVRLKQILLGATPMYRLYWASLGLASTGFFLFFFRNTSLTSLLYKSI